MHSNIRLARVPNDLLVQLVGASKQWQGNRDAERLKASSKRPFLARLFSSRLERDLFSPTNFQMEDEMLSVRERYGEASWRAHHETWLQSEVNRREDCEAYGVPLGNWRAKVKTEPQKPAPQAVYRPRGPTRSPTRYL